MTNDELKINLQALVQSGEVNTQSELIRLALIQGANLLTVTQKGFAVFKRDGELFRIDIQYSDRELDGFDVFDTSDPDIKRTIPRREILSIAI